MVKTQSENHQKIDHPTTRRICSGNTEYLTKAFEDATNSPYGYLVIGLTQTTPDHLRYRTNIFLFLFLFHHLPRSEQSVFIINHLMSL